MRSRAGVVSAVGLLLAAQAAASAAQELATPDSSVVLRLSEAASAETVDAPGCTRCRIWLVSNPTGQTLASSVSIAPYPPQPTADRSLGEWYYTYSRELAGTADDLTVVDASNEAAERRAASAIGSQVRFRLRAAVISGAPSDYEPGTFELGFELQPGETRTVTLYDGPVLASELQDSQIAPFLYWSLWSPLAALSRWAELGLEAMLPRTGSLFALVLIVLFVRLAMFPISRWSYRRQLAFEAVQRRIEPQVRELKRTLSGGDRSEAMLALYQSHGMNPLSGLKGSVSLFIQLPILVTVFNVASESAVLDGVSALWIGDVAQPDRTLAWGLDVPVLGGWLNVVAFAMAAFLIWPEFVKPKRSGGQLTLAVTVSVLLYSFPAFLVLYWFLNTIGERVERSLSSTRPQPAT